VEYCQNRVKLTVKIKTCFVTSGARFVGSALVRRLVSGGHHVDFLDNQGRGSATRLSDIGDDFEFVQADVCDSGAIHCTMKDVGSVCHLAFVNGIEFFYTKPDLVLDVGVKGMINVIDACIKNNVGELIVASSSEVYQTPPVVPTSEVVPLSIPSPFNPRYSYATERSLAR
jgi:nucleoside-diphosphate-sugar epimerase